MISVILALVRTDVCKSSVSFADFEEGNKIQEEEKWELVRWITINSS